MNCPLEWTVSTTQKTIDNQCCFHIWTTGAELTQRPIVIWEDQVYSSLPCTVSLVGHTSLLAPVSFLPGHAEVFDTWVASMCALSAEMQQHWEPWQCVQGAALYHSRICWQHGPRGQKRWAHPGSGSFCLPLSMAGKVVGISLVDCIFCHLCLCPSHSSESWLQDVVLKSRTSVGSAVWYQVVEVSLSPAKSSVCWKEPSWTNRAEPKAAEPKEPEQSWVEQVRATRSSSAGSSHVELSPASEAAVQCNVMWRI